MTVRDWDRRKGRKERKMKKESGTSFIKLWKRAKHLKYRSAVKTRAFKAAAPASETSHLAGGKMFRMLRNKQPMLVQKPLLYSTVCSPSSSFNSKHYLTSISNIKMLAVISNNQVVSLFPYFKEISHIM